jgi:hypothetical protein
MIDTARTLLVGLVVLPLGCSSGGMLNIGNTGENGGTTLTLTSYAGNWVGHAEAWSFGADGSDQVALTLDASGNGTVQVGNTPLPPPTDPDHEYPPNARDAQVVVWEGFGYPLRATRVEAGRLQFGVNTSDVYAAWCGLQTPFLLYTIPAGPDGGLVAVYGCGPNPSAPAAVDAGASAADGGYMCTAVGADGVARPIDCDKLYLCGPPETVCTCTATTCTAGGASAGFVPAQYFVNWDGALDAQPGSMTATLVIGTTRLTVHLTRQ